MKKLHSIFICVLLLLGLLATTSWGADKRPLVALEPIKTVTSQYGYVGKALTEMLMTRLSSQGIDPVLLGQGQAESPVLDLADFVVSGQVERKGSQFEASFSLKKPGKTLRDLKDWQIRAPNLDMLAKETSLFSAKLADTIKHAEEILTPVKESVPVGATATTGNQAKIENEFELARLHPDILVREKLEKDVKREKAEERMQAKEVKGSAKAEKGSAGKEDEGYSSWMPIPDVYNAATDDDTAEVTASKGSKAEKDKDKAGQQDVAGSRNGSSQLQGGANPEVADSGVALNASSNKGEKRGWLSWLWPFGKDKDKGPGQKETGGDNSEFKPSKKKEGVPHIVPRGQQVPLPPPPKVDFNIPEPVPLSRVLKKIDKMEVHGTVPREEKWYSWFWPWADDDQGEQGAGRAGKDGKLGKQADQDTAASQVKDHGLKYANDDSSATSRGQNPPVSTGDVVPSHQPKGIEGSAWQWK